MPPILHLGAVVQCSHGGTAQPTAPMPRVLVGGMPVVTLACPWVVAGCTLGTSPCATGQFVMGATRVLAGGVPVVTVPGVSVCAATPTPLVILSTQVRVNAL